MFKTATKMLQISLVFTLVTICFVSGDVSHLDNALELDGYHYEKPSIPFPPPPSGNNRIESGGFSKPPETYRPTQPKTDYLPPQGNKKEDGYHYDKPSVPFPPPSGNTHIESGGASRPPLQPPTQSTEYLPPKPKQQPEYKPPPQVVHKPQPGKVPPHNNNALQEDGYHYEKPSVSFPERPTTFDPRTGFIPQGPAPKTDYLPPKTPSQPRPTPDYLPPTTFGQRIPPQTPAQVRPTQPPVRPKPQPDYLPPQKVTQPPTRQEDGYHYDKPSQPFPPTSGGSRVESGGATRPPVQRPTPKTDYLPPKSPVQPKTPTEYLPPTTFGQPKPPQPPAPVRPTQPPVRPKPPTDYLPPQKVTPPPTRQEDGYHYDKPSQPFPPGGATRPPVQRPTPKTDYLPPKSPVQPKTPTEYLPPTTFGQTKPPQTAAPYRPTQPPVTARPKPPTDYLPPSTFGQTKPPQTAAPYRPTLAPGTARPKPPTDYLPPQRVTQPPTRKEDGYHYDKPSQPFPPPSGGSRVETGGATRPPVQRPTPKTDYLPPKSPVQPKTPTEYLPPTTFGQTKPPQTAAPYRPTQPPVTARPRPPTDYLPPSTFGQTKPPQTAAPYRPTPAPGTARPKPPTDYLPPQKVTPPPTRQEDGYHYDKPSQPFPPPSGGSRVETGGATRPPVQRPTPKTDYLPPKSPVQPKTPTEYLPPTTFGQTKPPQTAAPYRPTQPPVTARPRPPTDYLPPSTFGQTKPPQTAAPYRPTQPPATVRPKPPTDYLPPQRVTQPPTRKEDGYHYDKPSQPFPPPSSGSRVESGGATRPPVQRPTPKTDYLPPKSPVQPKTPTEYLPPTTFGQTKPPQTAAPYRPTQPPVTARPRPPTDYLPPSTFGQTKPPQTAAPYRPTQPPVTARPKPPTDYLPPQKATQPPTRQEDGYHYDKPSQPFPPPSGGSRVESGGATRPPVQPKTPTEYLPPTTFGQTKPPQTATPFRPTQPPVTARPKPPTDYLPPSTFGQTKVPQTATPYRPTQPPATARPKPPTDYLPPSTFGQTKVPQTAAPYRPTQPPATVRPKTDYLPPQKVTQPPKPTLQEDGYHYDKPSIPFSPSTGGSRFESGGATRAPVTRPSPNKDYLPPKSPAPKPPTDYLPPQKVTPVRPVPPVQQTPKPKTDYLPPQRVTEPSKPNLQEDGYHYEKPSVPFPPSSSSPSSNTRVESGSVSRPQQPTPGPDYLPPQQPDFGKPSQPATNTNYLPPNEPEPAHTFDADGYKYKVPEKRFDF